MIDVSASELAARLQRREVSALDVVDVYLERIALREPEIHAWTVTDPDRARAEARALDDGPVRGPLHGLPVGVKDLIDTADYPTGYGSSIYRAHRPAVDAACVAAARNAGAIVLGKTVTTEFATFTPAATVNPRNFAHTPGGSSSGSGAAVADGMAPLAFGTQTLGSVIRPASYCGVVGYKPSFGTVSRSGVKLLAPSLDTVGVMARTVADAAMFVGAIAARPELIALARMEAPLRVALWDAAGWADVEPAVHAAIESASRALSAAGADVSRLELPAEFVALRDANAVIFAFEVAQSLAHERRAYSTLLSERLRTQIDDGARISVERYEAALALAQAWRERIADAIGPADVLLAPSTTGEAPKGLGSTGSPIMNGVWTMLHLPCVTVPAGTGPEGLPIGLQVVGRFGSDASTLARADWIGRTLG